MYATTLPLKKRTILLISNDTRFHKNLRSSANAQGLVVARLHGATGLAPILHALNPGIILLDLDLPKRQVWEVAKALLNERSCPAVIPISGHGEQFDPNTVLCGGSVVNKAASAVRVLETIEDILIMLDSNRARRKAIQRILIRRPKGLAFCRWPLANPS